jgi:hypothetical protein
MFVQILGFVAFILAICADRRSTSSAWTEHITFETTLVVCVFIILYVVFPHLSLSNEQTREGLLVVVCHRKSVKSFLTI